MRRGYPSDLTNEQWAQIGPLFAQKPTGRPPELDRREVVNAILYLVRTGCQWRYLPGDFPNYSSVHTCYRRWRLDGTLERIHDCLRREVRRGAGREAEPSIAVVDSQSVKTTEKEGFAGLTRENV
jgi:putative transposase